MTEGTKQVEKQIFGRQVITQMRDQQRKCVELRKKYVDRRSSKLLRQVVETADTGG